MTWSYSLSSLATSKKDQVRLVIGDTGEQNPITGSTSQLVQDEEINFFLTIRSSIFGAAAECCRTIAAQFTLLGSYAAGDTKISFTGVSQAFSLRAAYFDQKAAMGAVPYVGGISVSDNQNNEDNPDRVNPQFALGMFDSNLPIGQLAVDAPIGQTDENQ